MRALESLDRGKENILMTVKSLLNPDQQFVCQELRWRAYEGEPKWHKIDNLLTTHFTPALCLFELIMSAIVTQRFRSVFRSRGWQPVHWFLQGACQIGIQKKEIERQWEGNRPRSSLLIVFAGSFPFLPQTMIRCCNYYAVIVKCFPL